jgi:hypothetical protein
MHELNAKCRTASNLEGRISRARPTRVLPRSRDRGYHLIIYDFRSINHSINEKTNLQT